MSVVYQVLRGCTYCNTCTYECPVNAITLTRQGAKIDPDRCTGCGRCAENCASDAIVRVEKPEASTKEK